MEQLLGPLAPQIIDRGLLGIAAVVFFYLWRDAERRFLTQMEARITENKELGPIVQRNSAALEEGAEGQKEAAASSRHLAAVVEGFGKALERIEAGRRRS